MRQKGKHDLIEPTASIDLSVKDFWMDVPEEIKRAIQKAKDQLDRGEGVSHDDVMARLRAQFPKR